MSDTEETRPDQLRALMAQAIAVGADVTVPVRTAAELAAVLDAIGGHNDYDPAKAARLLGPLVPDMMHVKVEHFVAGPAIHLGLPFWTNQTIKPSSGAPTKVDRIALAERVREVGKQLGADEISCRQFQSADPAWLGTGENPVEIRLWWD